MPRKRKFKDRTGLTYGLLTVKNLHSIEQTAPRTILWKCKCSCGNICIISSKSISMGRKSCGCLLKKVRQQASKKRTLPKEEAGLNKVFILYKSEAKKRKLDFSLKKNLFKNLILSNCHYCGSSPMNVSVVYRPVLGNFSFKYNGIDRKDNSIGYTLNNCVTCCPLCNLAKRKLNYNDFINHIKKIYEHIIKM